MTKLTLLPRKEFELTLEDGTVVSGQFGTWALSRFGQKRKLGLSATLQLFTDDICIADMLDFVLCAVEYKERQAGKAPFFNDLKLSAFIDAYSAESGESGVLVALINHANEDQTGEEKEKGEPIEWPALQRVFYSTGLGADQFWNCTLDEVVLIRKGQIDRWKVERMFAYQITISSGNYKNIPSIEKMFPLPEDDDQVGEWDIQSFYDSVKATWN